MLPVLLSFGKFEVSSFIVFLNLGIFAGVFLVWRLIKAWDLDEEKSLDLTFLTILFGFIGSRIIYIFSHFDLFSHSILNTILIYKQPGFSFWGGLLSGLFALFFFSKKLKMDFWQIIDLGSVAFLGGLIFADIGCLLGGCNVGIPSKLFFAVDMVGFGKRIPVGGIEAILITTTLFFIWSKATHFHIRGEIAGLIFIILGFIKLFTENFRQSHFGGYTFSIGLILLGTSIYYKVTKKNIISDFKNSFDFCYRLLKEKETRTVTLQILNKWWYNQKTSFVWKIKGVKKNIKKIYVKPS